MAEVKRQYGQISGFPGTEGINSFFYIVGINKFVILVFRTTDEPVGLEPDMTAEERTERFEEYSGKWKLISITCADDKQILWTIN